MSAMSSMIVHDVSSTLAATTFLDSPHEDAPRDWKPNSIFCPREIHFESNRQHFIHCQLLCSHVMVTVSLRITGRRVTTDVVACRSDDTAPFRSFGHSGRPSPCLVWSSPCGWQARQDHALSLGSLRLLARQPVARVASSSCQTPTGRSPPPPLEEQELAHSVHHRNPSKAASKALVVKFRLHATKPIL
jgi:hypothetical protein